ncbi:chaperone protein dnaJ 11, chloroplastic-like [Panicum miliaceum]|uniref:Chaperone protein dnaJ 11, chloroplastic-like n=1 Tax=Panicum miliaceum TaxID=4540 RepID=A0A3L6PSA4_PANMI|nr:chaperone protein dnaJ 11, chloroplastic-like [Panicum miliaceum]
MISAPLRVPAPRAAAGIGTPPFRSASASSAPKPGRIRCAAAAAPPAGRGAPTLYEVLGLRAGATVREIKAAYRRLARERHPDVAGAAPGAAAEFVRLHDAYATLSDPDSRARYDGAVAVAVAVARRPYPRWAAGPGYGRPRRAWETDQCW